MSTSPELPAAPDPEAPRKLVVARSTETGVQPAAPHPLGPLRPAVARLPIVLITTLLFVGAAIYVGVTRSPTYTASSTINVGRTDVRVQALPGYVAGAQALAGSYSRVVTSQDVLAPVAKRVGLPFETVKSRLSSTPIPGSSMFTIKATGPDTESAIRLASAATRQVKSYVHATDSGDQSVVSVLRQYRAQARKVAKLNRRIARLRQNIQNGTGSGNEAKLAAAETDRDSAQLQEQSLQSIYINRSAEVDSTAGIQVIDTPVSATNDRNQMLQRLVVVGLLAGLAVGAALAVMFVRARRSRLPL
jgi:uncharacterized protein involved in exopolysaccharide biosynthesis